MSSTKTKIMVKDLNVHYSDLHVLKNINLEIPENKITAIIGPSGCGKTTLLKCFNRLTDLNSEIRTSGQILLDGENIYDPRFDVIELRKRVGLLSQTPSPLPMSIFENVAYGLKIHGIKKKVKNGLIVD